VSPAHTPPTNRVSRPPNGGRGVVGERESGREGGGVVLVMSVGWVVMAMLSGGRKGGGVLVDLGVTEVFPGELGLVP